MQLSDLRDSDESLYELRQLFNSMDPAPFIEQDLDADAERFIVESAAERPLAEPVELVVHLATAPDDSDPHHVVLTAIHHYFRERAEQARLAFRRLMRQGQVSLLIGIVFLASCFTGAELLDKLHSTNRLLLLLREGLVIAGWVAMWRPMEIFLYDWWPIRDEARLFDRLTVMPVRIAYTRDAGSEAWRWDWPAVAPSDHTPRLERPGRESPRTV